MTERSGRREGNAGRRLLAAPAVLCAALTLAACGGMGRFETASPTTSAPAKPNRTVAQTPASEREHERILASYGGAYDDLRLEALIGKTVDRLVAASDRPDQAYRVTILNSGAVNAFALPTGQLYVTRGLVALASDTSELSSVLSHEMAHVLAKHASIREDQARQAAVVTRVVTDMSNDPDLTALALAKTKLTMASFSRAQEFEADGIGVGISARAGFDPYGAQRFLNSMGLYTQLRARTANIDGDEDILEAIAYMAEHCVKVGRTSPPEVICSSTCSVTRGFNAQEALDAFEHLRTLGISASGTSITADTRAEWCDLALQFGEQVIAKLR